MIRVAAALALLAPSSAAQDRAYQPLFPLRPTARAEFKVASTRYLGAGIDERLVEREIEEKLFPATFLRARAAGETARFTLTITLIEKANDSSELVPAYLRCELEGPFVWPPAQGTAFHKLLRSEKDAGRAITALGLRAEISTKLDELAANPDELVQGLLCYVPLASDGLEPRRSYFFEDTADAEFQVRLPFRHEDVGLEPKSEFLLYVQSDDRRIFHVVRSAQPRTFAPGLELPGYLADGIVGRDRAAALETVRVQPASAGATALGSVALYENQLPDEEDIKPLALHGRRDASPRLLDTLSIHVVRARPTKLSAAPAPPSAVAAQSNVVPR